MSYLSKHGTQRLPQWLPLPGQVRNSAGGHAWAVDVWTRLRRFLVLPAIVLALQTKTVRPSLPLIGLSLLIGVVWVATGFHVNGYDHLADFNPLGEALNEGAKTAWGLAYLLPLIRLPAPAPVHATVKS